MEPFRFATCCINFIEVDLNDLAECISSIENLIEQKLTNSLSYSEQQYPNTIRGAFFMSCYSQMETYLNSVCRNCQLDQKLKISYEDMAQQGISRAMLYFEKALGLNFPSNANWLKIQQYRQLRNIVVHNGGCVKPSELKKVKRILLNIPYFNLSTLNSLNFEREFCLEFINVQIELLREIFVVLNEYSIEVKDECYDGDWNDD
ncbi:hypothetical protein [uncultured Anaeromusa sp.]|uniref:hypothetical protein n=1 Tax=uncultured Anaeromusa sp. TaxID=673273 RepID=UPI0029C85E98|nr:hypothetical protein [uncultured Anaeromusa sp.]